MTVAEVRVIPITRYAVSKYNGSGLDGGGWEIVSEYSDLATAQIAAGYVSAFEHDRMGFPAGPVGRA